MFSNNRNYFIMELKQTIIGNVAKVTKLQKADGTPYLRVEVGTNKSKEEVIYTTIFLYGVSDKRAERITRGSLIFASGNYTDEIYVNEKELERLTPSIKAEVDPTKIASMIKIMTSINRVLNAKDFDVLYSK